MKQQFLFLFFAIALASCNSLAGNTQVIPPSVTTPEVAESSDQTPSSGIESTVEISANETEFFSSDHLGLCFSYPKGYTQISFDDPILSINIAAPDLPGTDTKGRLHLEISDAYNRTAERIADEDMTYAVDHIGVPLESLGRWTVTLGGEQAVVLNGMPGQEFRRQVYIVRQQTLYVLNFSPARSENKVANDQMEALYTMVTNSWIWSPCSMIE
ncbi:MAG TPA: hypothetical protein VLA72_18155 [Anaerolineales bacterium]|nr:hypothetical protein [Anaerolineales bacterium]